MKNKSVWIKNYLQLDGDRFVVIAAKRKLGIIEMQKILENKIVEEHKRVDEHFKKSTGFLILHTGK